MPASGLRNCTSALRRPVGLGRPGSVSFVIMLVAVLLMGAVAPAQADGNGNGSNITVMTRNMDSGTDYGPLFAAASANDLAAAVTSVYQEVVDSQPAQRAAGIAQEIANTEPDLVSLQEVETWYTGPLFATSPDATVTVDQLAALLSALANLGQSYQAIAIVTNTDLQAPSTMGISVRVTDHDVILARTDGSFTYSNVQTGHYQAALVLPTAVGTLAFPRGWASVDANNRQRTFRFIATHLESFSTQIQLAQAQELAAGPANTQLPVVLAGDLNSAAVGGPDSGATYTWLTTTGGLTMDAWSTANPGQVGYTWPLFLEDPNRPATPTERIDIILARGLLATAASQVGAAAPYPSDHLGVVATVR